MAAGFVHGRAARATKKKAASFQDMLDRFCRKYDHRT
jgi:hypothetical protein